MFDNAAESVCDILSRHWDILLMDPYLKKFDGTYPSLTYRRGQNLRDRLVHSHFSPPDKSDSWLRREVKGCFRCGGCVACRFIKPGHSFSSNTTKEVFQICQYINCRSTGVIHKAHGSLGVEYMGKTTHELRRRVGEHLGYIRHQHDTPLSRHIWKHYHGDINNLCFQLINLIQPSVRKGDFNRLILQKECYWIFKLYTVDP